MNNIEKENKNVRFVLAKKEILMEFVKKQIDNWFESKVKGTRSGWFHIHKGLDLIIINAEGYNTPPLTTLEIDIENLNSELSDEISRFVYEYLQEKLHVDKQSEYLTYTAWNRYAKEENEFKNELSSEENEQIGEEKRVDTDNKILSIVQSLKENGNCKIYYGGPGGDGKALYIYNLAVDDNGRLNANLELRLYDFIVCGKKGIDIERVNDYYSVQEISNDVISNLVNIFYSCEFEENFVISSHESNKNQDRTLALNELYLYINQMYNVFGNEENFVNSLDSNGLLAKWIKCSITGRLNIFHRIVNPSYDEMLNDLSSSADRFRSICEKAKQDWQKIRNGEDFLVFDETNKQKTSKR